MKWRLRVPMSIVAIWICQGTSEKHPTEIDFKEWMDSGNYRGWRSLNSVGQAGRLETQAGFLCYGLEA